MLSLIFSVLLFIAVTTDLRTRRIPNAVCLIIAILGVMSRVWMFGLGGLESSMISMLIVGLLFVVPWQRGMIGGGDHKLLIACASFFAWDRTLWMLLITILAGGVEAIVWIISKKVQDRASWNEAWKTSRMPYSLAIAFGAMTVMLFADRFGTFGL